MSDFVTVRIARARHAQLGVLQDHFGAKSIAATVERLITDEMSRSGLSESATFAPQNPSGIVIEPMSVETDRAVFFGVGSDDPVMFSLPEATRFAEALDRAAVKGAERWRLERTVWGSHTIVVARRGRGIVIEINGNPTAIGEGIAKTIAATIRDTITRATELDDGTARPVLDYDPDQPQSERVTQVLNMLRPSDRGTVDPAKIKTLPNAE